MLQKILANSDNSDNILEVMKKSVQDVSEDYDNFEFEEPDDLREFFED